MVHVQDRPLEEGILEHITKLLQASVTPDIPEELKDNAELRKIHDYFVTLRGVLMAFSRGDMSQDITLRGVLAGNLKALQANMLHLTWQIQQVAEGDFSQRVDFLGTFSSSFNDMVVQLNAAITALRQKEEELTHLTLALQHEIEQKAEALAALRKSEASFRYMAEHDSLTEVLNRRSFYNLAPLELAKAQKEGYPCSLVIFDIDHFKRFNDTHGHLEGDVALRHVTEVVKVGLRHRDLMARYGGEEFVLFFPSASIAVGKAVAERMRAAIAASPIATQEGKTVTVTVSLGLVTVPPDVAGTRNTAFLEEVLRHADEALYSAKAAGRNRLMVSPYPDVCLLPESDTGV